MAAPCCCAGVDADAGTADAGCDTLALAHGSAASCSHPRQNTARTPVVSARRRLRNQDRADGRERMPRMKKNYREMTRNASKAADGPEFSHGFGREQPPLIRPTEGSLQSARFGAEGSALC